MAKKKKTTPRDPLLSQSQLEANVRYGPQLSQLASLLSDTKAQRVLNIHAARGTGEALQQYVRQNQPALEKVYNDAQDRSSSLASTLAEAFKGATPSYGPYAGAIRDELAAADKRGTLERTAALSDFARLGADAAQGAAFQERSIRSQSAADEQKIRGKASDIVAQSGEYIAGRLGDLKEKQRGRAVTRHGQEVSAANQRANRDLAQRRENRLANKDKGLDAQGNPLPKKPGKGGKGGTLPGGVKPATAVQQGAFEDGVQAALTQAKRLKREGRSRSEAADALVAGRPQVTVKDDKGNSVPIPGVPKTKQLHASIALDAVYGNGVSAGNVRRAHSRGYKVKGIGVPTVGKAPKSPAAKKIVTDIVKGLP